MLLKYIVSNYKSIGNELEFSMLPVEEHIDDDFVTSIQTKMGEWKVLRRGAFFGPNASGKSNFIKSFEFASDFIVNGRKSGKSTGIDQFRAEIEGITDSKFQFMLYIEGDVYDYGFSLNKKKVTEEWLMVLSSEGFKTMFTRVTNDINETKIEVTSRLARNNSKSRNLIDALKEGMKENQKNQLFLYKLFDNGVKKAEKIVSWFEKINFIYPGTKLQGLPIKVSMDSEFSEFLSDNLRLLDTGIYKIAASTKKISFQDMIDKMEIPNEVAEEIEGLKNGILNIDGKYFIFSEDENSILFVQLKFEHHLNNSSYDFSREDESDGTKRLLDLLPILFRLNRSTETIYMIDELDRSLHTKLSKYLLNAFIKNTEGSRSQMIFTAHDVNLLTLDNLRQDEIWFIEKKSTGETIVKPFSDFDISKDQNVIKDYLNGRFGAVPVIKGE